METPKQNPRIHISRFTCGMFDGLSTHFIPQEKNGHVPHVLKHRVLLAYSVIAILLKALLVLGYSALPVASVYSSSVTSGNVIKLTNVARSAAGLSELRSEDRLALAAQGKAEDMIVKQYFAHTSPDGLTPWYWIKNAGYMYKLAGENLAIHYFTAEGVHEGWMASPSHKDNIMNPRFVDTGVGVVQGRYQGYDTVAVVQMFGQPKSTVQSAAEPESTPESAAPAVDGSASQPDSAPTVLGSEDPIVEPAETAEPEEAIPFEAGPTETETTEPASEPASASSAPELNQSSLTVLPTENGYQVSAEIKDATQAEAYLGPDATPLVEVDDGLWQGTLETKNAGPEDGTQYMIIGASSEDGQRSYTPVAAVMSGQPTQDVFAVNAGQRRSFKLFGLIQIDNLEDKVNHFYLFALVFLGAALLMKVAIRLHVQRHSVILHTLLVMALVTVLLFI